MITDELADAAFHWLWENTRKIGAAKARLERTEILRKRARKRVFLCAPEGSVAAKEAFAENHPDVLKADRGYVRAVLHWESLRADQDIKTIALDVWRTESANRRRA